MPKISITSLKREIFCSQNDQTVLAAIHDNSIDWMYACGAKGHCNTCVMVVLDGYENISNLTRNEMFFRNQSLLKENERLACQCTLTGDIKIRVPESFRLPHLTYFD